jgi:hypothetical protein
VVGVVIRLMGAITEESYFDCQQARKKLSRPTRLPVLEVDHSTTSSAKVRMCGAGPPLHPFMACTGTCFPHKHTETQAISICEVRKIHKIFCRIWR